uniref:Uncharacterized protein n=1 Tax=Arundo donax TaxID=35708 RepID=A0A0A8XYU4_ARUDO
MALSYLSRGTPTMSPPLGI